MKIMILMENEPSVDHLYNEHGLSIYIEVGNHKILMDSGQSDKTYANALELGIDVKDIDIFVLSHGHYDHGNGFIAFHNVNDKAKIYMQESCKNEFYHGERYIGLNKEIFDYDNIEYLNGDIDIDETVSIFTNISNHKIAPKGNKRLLKKENNTLIMDDFNHEQCLVIKEDDLYVLFSGCAHHGILNVLDTFYLKYGRYPDAVFSGFHMASKKGYDRNDIDEIVYTAKVLNELDTMFYTGHCTGIEAFEILYEHMDFIEYMHVGDQIEIIETGDEDD